MSLGTIKDRALEKLLRTRNPGIRIPGGTQAALPPVCGISMMCTNGHRIKAEKITNLRR